MKPFITTLCSLAFVIPAGAATYVGPDTGLWNAVANWDSGTLPAVSAGAGAVISSGATVTYEAGALGDLNLNGGGSLRVAGGSTWVQSDIVNWSQVNNGTLTLENGTFRRNIGGHLVGSQIAGIAGAPTTSIITATSGSLIEIGAGNFVLGFTNFTTATATLTDSTAIIGGELWLGSADGTDSNQVSTLNLHNSSITTKGAVGLWVWDYNAQGNSTRINFTGAAGSFIEVSDSIGVRAAGAAANNQSTWESLWDLGILTAQGQSGLTGAAFGSHFVTTGTSARDSATPVAYRLTLIPEPSSALLAGACALMPVLRRRRK